MSSYIPDVRTNFLIRTVLPNVHVCFFGLGFAGESGKEMRNRKSKQWWRPWVDHASSECSRIIFIYIMAILGEIKTNSELIGKATAVLKGFQSAGTEKFAPFHWMKILKMSQRSMAGMVSLCQSE